jgi:hypothetical protein
MQHIVVVPEENPEAHDEEACTYEPLIVESWTLLRYLIKVRHLTGRSLCGRLSSRMEFSYLHRFHPTACERHPPRDLADAPHTYMRQMICDEIGSIISMIHLNDL